MAPDRPPTLTGRAGRAWRWEPDEGAQLSSWVVHCPGSHPFWPWHVVTTVHLRPEPGAPPASLRFPEATHELLVISLNPDFYPPPTCKAEGLPFYLEPPDVCEQFIADDDHARELCNLAARACVAGILVPDSDYRGAWHASIASTLDHFAGRHGDRP